MNKGIASNLLHSQVVHKIYFKKPPILVILPGVFFSVPFYVPKQRNLISKLSYWYFELENKFRIAQCLCPEGILYFKSK